jgi:hypothetical protein
MTKQEFEHILVFDYYATKSTQVVYKLGANFKILHIQVLDNLVCLMMSDSLVTTNSYTCIIEITDSKGDKDYNQAFKKMESMIYG